MLKKILYVWGGLSLLLIGWDSFLGEILGIYLSDLLPVYLPVSAALLFFTLATLLDNWDHME